MDEETLIIDEKTRNEKIRYFFRNNKKKIIILILIAVISLLSFFGYGEYKDIKKEQISDYYNSAVTDYSNGNLDIIGQKLVEIVREKDPTYSPLALYFIIDNNLAESREQVNSLFDVLINKTTLEKEIENLIIYKKALFNVDFIKENELLEILKPILNSESIWKSHALYLVAEYFFSKNEKQKSKEFYEQILKSENVNQEILQETKKRLNRDLSD
tara:strand:+ start:87 stop:731 length:645 start_codon:yes stop_codon:yes gene_type:complete